MSYSFKTKVYICLYLSHTDKLTQVTLRIQDFHFKNLAIAKTVNDTHYGIIISQTFKSYETRIVHCAAYFTPE